MDDYHKEYLKLMTTQGLFNMASHYTTHEGGAWLPTDGFLSNPPFHSLRIKGRYWDVISGFRPDESAAIRDVSQQADLFREPGSGAEDVLT